MTLGEKVVAQQRRVNERLHDAVHEAGGAQVHEAAQANRGGGADAAAQRMLQQLLDAQLLDGGPGAPRYVLVEASADCRTEYNCIGILFCHKFKMKAIDV